MKTTNTAKSVNLTTCLHCHSLVSLSENRCHVCDAKLELRKTDSLNRTIALLIASFICFFPANILPITIATAISGTQEDTILSGVVFLWHEGMWPIAAIVFTASILTPLFKILSLGYLCLTVKLKSTKHTHFRSKLYEFTELIGRWSMIDIFVVALLGALIQMGRLATMTPGPGVYALFVVVVLTIFAAESFDVRLLWDEYNDEDKHNDDSEHTGEANNDK